MSNKHSGGQGYYQYSPGMEPTMAFRSDGIEFWGSALSNLDEIKLSDKDLIINATGSHYNFVPFVKSAPSWITIERGTIPHQLLLGWEDFGVPPESMTIKVWKDLIAESKEQGIERIICCCGAGQGRTGTALSALLLATGIETEPDLAIKMIRRNYTNKAVENDDQEIYLYSLVYDIENAFDSYDDSSEDSETWWAPEMKEGS